MIKSGNQDLTSLLFAGEVSFCFAFRGQGSLGWIVPLSSSLFFDLGDMIAKSCFLQKIL